MPPVNKSQILTSSLRLTICTFTLLLGPNFLFESHIFTQLRQQTLSTSHNDFNTAEDNMRMTERFPTSTELCKEHLGIKISVDFLKIILNILGQNFM
jgi:hypothetical protein